MISSGKNGDGGCCEESGLTSLDMSHHGDHHFRQLSEKVDVGPIDGGSKVKKQEDKTSETLNEEEAARSFCLYFRVGNLLLGIGTVCAVGLGAFFFLHEKQNVTLKQKSARNDNYQGIVYLADLEQHHASDDCWMALYAKVYDLTKYSTTHPAGCDWITDYCGMEATQPYSVYHSEKLLELIPETLLGTFVEEEGMANSTLPKDDSEIPDGSMAGDQNQSLSDVQSAMCELPFYNKRDVLAHSSEDDCWYILYGVVYDFTDYLAHGLHPPCSDLLVQACGTDATKSYSKYDDHDEELLKRNAYKYVIGIYRSEAGQVTVPCEPRMETSNNSEEFQDEDSAAHSPEMCQVQAYTSRDVAAHAMEDDCWYILYGVIYDLTEYIALNMHPAGSDLVVRECGTDATEVYSKYDNHDEALLKQDASDFAIGIQRKKSCSYTIPCKMRVDKNDRNTTQVGRPTSQGTIKPTTSSSSVLNSTTHSSQNQSAVATPLEPTAMATSKPQEQKLCQQQFYDLNDVSQHANENDCWYVLYGVVYDLTEYAPNHPAGARWVTPYCGMNATSIYSAYRGHDEALLARDVSQYLIGLEGTDTKLVDVSC